MSVVLSRCVFGFLPRHAVPCSVLSGQTRRVVQPLWSTQAMTLKTSAPLRAEPKRKKKVDPRREQLAKERLKKKLKKLERVAPEFIPIDDFVFSRKCLDEERQRVTPRLSFEKSEGRALLQKEWSRYKQKQHKAEMGSIELAIEAQREALNELKLESEELYQAALTPDPLLFPFVREGPTYTPPIPNYQAPDGKQNDITQVHTQ